MAKPCRYKIPGTDTYVSEEKFKEMLNDGLLDKFLLDDNIAVRGLKIEPDNEAASKYRGDIEIEEEEALGEEEEEVSAEELSDEDLMSLNNVDAFYGRDEKTQKELESWWERTLRGGANPIAAVNDVYSLLQDTYRGSLIKKGNAQLKEYVDNNIAEPLKDAVKNMQSLNQEVVDDYDDALKDIFGSTRSGRNALKKDADIPHPDREFRMKGKKATNDVLVNIYNLSRREGNKERLENQLIDLESVVNYIESNPELKKYADWLIDNYNTKGKERYEQTYIEYTNSPFPEEEVYYPERSDSSLEEETIDASTLMNDDFNFSDSLTTSTGASGHMKKRTGGGKLDWNRDASEVYFSYNDSMSRAKHMMPISTHVNTLFNKANNPYLLENMGPRAYADLKENLLTTLTGKSPRRSGRVENFVKSIGGFTVVTTLMGKPKQIITQASGALHFMNAGIKYGLAPTWTYNMAKTGVLGTIAGTAAAAVTTPFKSAAGQIPVNKEELQFMKHLFNSPFIRQRWKGGSIDYELRNLLNDKTGKGFKNFVSSASGLALITTRLGDMGAILIAPGGGLSFANALFRKYRSEGMSVEEATDKAYKAFAQESEETQQTTRDDLMSSTQRDPIWRLLGMYKSGQTGMAKKTIKAYKTLISNAEPTPEEKVQALYDMIYYPLMGSAVFSALAGGAIRLAVGDDDEDESVNRRLKYDWVMDSMQGTVQGYGVPGMIVDGFLNEARGKGKFNNIPVMKKLSEMYKGVTDYKKATEKKPYGELSREERGKFLEEQGINPRSVSYQEAEKMYEQWGGITEDEFSKMAKTIGVKNFVDLYDDFRDYYRGKQELQEAIMNWDDGTEYLEKQREFDPGKRDFIYEYATKVLTGKAQPYLPQKKKQKKATKPKEYIKEYEREFIPEYIKGE